MYRIAVNTTNYENRIAELEAKNARLKREKAAAMRAWDAWKAYAMELHDRLRKYEPGTSVMLLNDGKKGQPK